MADDVNEQLKAWAGGPAEDSPDVLLLSAGLWDTLHKQDLEVSRVLKLWKLGGLSGDIH
jgi:hypothetical protein